MSRSPSTAVLLLAGALASSAVAQTPPADTSWNATLARGKPVTVDFTTSEGTWMSVDLSPDGAWVIFDLLGHIYRMPAGGGTAEPLTQGSGTAVNIQPRYSPDGKSIAFVSDRKGQSNLWIMDADGGNPRPVFLDDGATIRSPVWTPDGQYLIATKNTGFVGKALVMFHRDGGRGVELVKGEPGKMPDRPAVSADGRYLYYEISTVRMTGVWGRDDLLGGTMQLRRLDLRTGEIRPITDGVSEQQDRATSGSAYGAEVSPDGRWLSFVRRMPAGTMSYKGQKFGPRSALWLLDLRSGAERLVMDPVEQDNAEEGIPINGSYPRYRWTPDGMGIVILQGGRVRRLDLASGQVATIPFTARVRRTVSEVVRATHKVEDGPVEVRFPRWYTASPDGRALAFQAVGKIWVMGLPSGTPRRVTPDSFGPMEFMPAWSPDGATLAFTTWDDSARGALWTVPVAGGAPRRLTPEAGEYLNPSWSPDGASLVVARGAGVTARAMTMARNPWYEIVRIPAAGGVETDLAQVTVPTAFFPGAIVPRPVFGPGDRVYFTESKTFGPGEGGRPQTGVELQSISPDGADRRTHARIVNATEAAPSPDGKWVAFHQGGDVFVAPFQWTGLGGQIPQLDKNGGAIPVTRLSSEGGLYPRWRNATTLDFGSGQRFYARDVGAARTDTVAVRLTVPRALPAGTIALTGARIVTLDGRQVIERGTLVAKAGRITCVGECDTRGVEKVVDVSGKTIIPGWVDVHAHHHREHAGMMPAHNFETAVYLAYGVTTTLDPSSWSPETFPSAELVEAGAMVGPRIFATAEAVTEGDGPGTNAITSPEVALREAARRKSWGTVSLKEYLQPTRQQRQYVVEAGRALGLNVTSEGSMDLPHKLSLIFDGHTGFEHVTALTPLYGDVTRLIGALGQFYSPTPLVGGPSGWNEEYFWQESPVWRDPKQQKWIPWRQLIPHTRRFIMRPETDYPKDIIAQTVADVIAAGGYGAVGSHGQQHGLGSHWDVWIAARALGNHGALEMASLHGAKFLGMDRDLGSLARGKLADLMVLNGNPLDDIRKTADLRYVMKGGVLYDADSLDEIWPTPRRFGDTYWVVPEMYRSDTRGTDAWERP